MRRPLFVLLPLVAMAAVLLPAPLTAAPAPAGQAPVLDDMVAGRPDGATAADAKDRPVRGTAGDVAGLSNSSGRAAGNQRRAATIGAERTWLAYDDVEATDYLKDFTLRGMGENIEVWVASDEDEVASALAFPAGDCRNDERIQVTDEQIAGLIDEFSNTILPTESAAFSVAPDRDGTTGFLAAELELPAGYWRGDGDNTVVLVDNVRDTNFYSLEESPTFIAGFFTSFYNEAFDRNVMTIDGYDWLHRTGANPPDEPVPGDLCASKPGRPYGYEGVFAHEYQHLLESYEDPAETVWVNEGLSMYAERITGYSDPSLPVDVRGFEALTQCFLGFGEVTTPFNPNPRQGGPENSLTVWGDQGDGDEILCDYGAANTMMEYLAGRYGEAFLTALHRDDLPGLTSLAALVEAVEPSTSALDLVHDWAATVAVDAALEDGSGVVRGDRDRFLTAPTLDASINWDNDDAYSTPGAPPNGSDYVRLRNAAGRYMGTRNLRSLAFDGGSTLPTLPIEWQVDPDPEGQPGDAALYTGSGPNFDRAVITPVTVPTADPTLTFETAFDTEETWDFGFVQVSTDGGETYTSLANDATSDVADPGAVPAVIDALPGFTGSSGGWTEQSFDLGAYAGQEILLAFRYVTDSSVDGPGWWVDDIAVGGVTVSDGTNFDAFQSATEIRPVPVDGFTVQLIAYRSGGGGPVFVRSLRLDGDLDGDLSRMRRRFRRRGIRADVVAAIVTYDDPTEAGSQYAPYTLTANDVVQPGGADNAAPAPSP